MTPNETSKPKVLILVVSYHAEAFIESVLKRIPDEVSCGDAYDVEILVVDDSSADETFEAAHRYSQANLHLPIKVIFNPVNLGYGGNQKLGYHYAIENGFDAVVLLHGDGQYAPEMLPEMIAPILAGEADVVLGSRMVKKSDALRGGMPFYKWVGNQILTGMQNLILHTNLAEFHTGYRAYRTASLARVRFDCNADYYDFDTDILIQMIDTRARFREIAIPTFYGDEISRVDGIRYGLLILRTSLLSRVVKRGIFYNPKFDYETADAPANLKLDYPSSHRFALDHVKDGSTVLDIGDAAGLLAEQLSEKGCRTVAVGRSVGAPEQAALGVGTGACVEGFEFPAECAGADAVLLLDVLEHLKSPETLLAQLRHTCSHNAPDVVVTTGNVAFFPVRMSLLFGAFNYSRRGILDLTHTRLFTFGSLRRLLQQSGYRVTEIKGIPAPYPLAFGNNGSSRFLLWLNRILIHVSRSLFAYQIACVATPLPTLDVLLARAEEASSDRLSGASVR